MKFNCCGGSDYFLYSSPRRSLIIDLDGAMIIPQYKYVPRAACRMLCCAWERRWEELVRRCEVKPDEAFAKTEHSGRTALHLATFNEGCPLDVAVALLKANRHAILVEDRNSYTPLHNLGLFRGGDELMSLFCDTAIMVEQELQGRGKLPTPSRTSPLYLAAKRDAPTTTLRLLLQTRPRSQWIAPFTGGESYWDPQQTLDKFSSPLEILMRGRSACFVGLSTETKQQMKDMVQRNFSLNQEDDTTNTTCTTPTNNDNNNQSLMTDTCSEISIDQHDQNAITIWEKCFLLLQENFRTIITTTNTKCTEMEKDASEDTTRIPKPTTPSLVHTVASLKVPMPILLQLAMELFPEQLWLRDDTGNYPLVHVLESNHPYATKQLIHILLECKNKAETTESKHTTNITTTTSRTSSHPPPVLYIQECLQSALEIGLTWDGGMKDIVMANSEVLSLPYPQSRLVPAFLAAAQDAALDTIYFLLHAEPQVVVVSPSS
ncbi:expressed unknown protein [Seminavis robusta]|uniref:Uncharacterized protein n=1 Tax=Seminavis robusta TaxID=568900 RepID=A0A9N8DJ40_9STRA|nr:expressed unknown protein [Seminavis robusta]|eukprot:Sro169_g075180.1 n/a (490) ;mRNA; f:71928-73397